MALRVLYNAMSARVGGGLTYAREQVAALAGTGDVELTVLTSPWNGAAFEEVAAAQPALRLQPVAVPSVAARFGWELAVLPVRARAHDVLLCPANFGPPVATTPTVVILQNPNYVGVGRRLPQNAGAARRLKIAQSHLSMRRADLVISVSDALTAEIRSEPRLRGADVRTVRTGAPTPDGSGRAPAEAAACARRLTGADPYLLSVSNDYAHKRLDDLARLLVRLDGAAEGVPRRVVLAGDVPEARRTDLRAVAGTLADRLVFLGSVADREVVQALYRGAAASVSTSELESWGLTLHEAGALGCPVVVTDLPVHRELADGHARFFPVGDLAELVRQLEEAVAGPRPQPWSLDRPWSAHGAELAAALHGLVR